MANFFNNFFLKRVYKGPSTHFVKPKALNIRFKGNVLPNYTYLNLETVLSASPEMSKNEKGQFEIKLNITFLDKTNQTMTIGLFNDEDLARQAYARTINSFFSPTFSILKFFLTLAVVIIALQFTAGFMLSMGNIISKRNAALANSEQQMKQNEFDKMNQLLKQQSQQKGNLGISDIRNPSIPTPQMESPLPNTGNPSLSQLRQQNKDAFSSVTTNMEDEITAIREQKNQIPIEENKALNAAEKILGGLGQ